MEESGKEKKEMKQLSQNRLALKNLTPMEAAATLPVPGI